MYLTQSNVIRGLSKQDYTMLREMCQCSNNLYNVAVYTIRQHYFDTQQFLRYEKNCHVCKENENYRLLQAGFLDAGRWKNVLSGGQHAAGNDAHQSDSPGSGGFRNQLFRIV